VTPPNGRNYIETIKTTKNKGAYGKRDPCLPVSLELEQLLFELFHGEVRLSLAQFTRDQLVMQSLYLR